MNKIPFSWVFLTASRKLVRSSDFQDVGMVYWDKSFLPYLYMPLNI